MPGERPGGCDGHHKLVVIPFNGYLWTTPPGGFFFLRLVASGTDKRSKC
jgi:hypothetical protein